MAAKEEVDVCDNWEDIDENGLDKRINDFMAKEEINTPKKPAAMNGFNIFLDENTVESQFMAQEPSIKILKRPSNANNGLGSSEIRARPVKTLQQRQKEYEEARLRILGEAKSPEDSLDDKLDSLDLKLTDKVTLKERPDITNIANESTKSPPGVLILRSPRAPDGTKGFTERR